MSDVGGRTAGGQEDWTTRVHHENRDTIRKCEVRSIRARERLLRWKRALVDQRHRRRRGPRPADRGRQPLSRRAAAAAVALFLASAAFLRISLLLELLQPAQPQVSEEGLHCIVAAQPRLERGEDAAALLGVTGWHAHPRARRGVGRPVLHCELPLEECRVGVYSGPLCCAHGCARHCSLRASIVEDHRAPSVSWRACAIEISRLLQTKKKLHAAAAPIQPAQAAARGRWLAAARQKVQVQRRKLNRCWQSLLSHRIVERTTTTLGVGGGASACGSANTAREAEARHGRQNRQRSQ